MTTQTLTAAGARYLANEYDEPVEVILKEESDGEYLTWDIERAYNLGSTMFREEIRYEEWLKARNDLSRAEAA